MVRPRFITVVWYIAGLVLGTTLAMMATSVDARTDIYVMFAVLLVVGMALGGGTGPALMAAITAVVGDDLLLARRLPEWQHWEHLVAFGGVAISVGWLVAAKRRQQLETEQALLREQQLRNERSAILAVVSHDVRSPLGVILGTARQGRAVAAGGEATRLFGRIESAALHAHHLVEVLTDLRSFDGQTMHLEVARRDLRETVATVIDHMQALSSAHQIIGSLAPGAVFADYDEDRVRRVLANLIGNAIKYSPAGGRVEVRLDASDDAARISVRDEGIGIPADARERVFERGYRASTAQGISGTGLGLFISAEIVKLHGGGIACAAAPDRGTVFTITLPRRVQLPAETPRAVIA